MKEFTYYFLSKTSKTNVYQTRKNSKTMLASQPDIQVSNFSSISLTDSD